METPLVGVEITDFEENLQFVNQQFADMLGYQKEELEGKHISELMSEKEYRKIQEKIKERKEEKREVYESELIRKDGSKIDVLINAAPFKNLKGEITGGCSIVLDITERKEMEEALKEREEKYRTIFESANDAIFIMKEDRFIDCNEKTTEIFECSRDDIVGKAPYKFSPEEQPDGMKSKEKALEKINEALEGKPQSLEWMHTTEEGEPFHTHVTLNRYEIDDEEFVMAIVRDISELKQTEEELRRSKNRYETLFEENPQALVEVDDNHRISNLNKQFEDLFKYDEEEILGEHLNDLIVPEDKIEEAEELDERSKEGYFEHETVRKTKDGEEVPVVITGRPIEQDEKTHYLGIYTDISERKKAEEQIEEGKKKIEELHQVSAKLETCQSEDEVYSYALEAAEEILEFDISGFDVVEGGVGFFHDAYTRLEELGAKSVKRLKECSCKSVKGCPACTFSPDCGNDNEPLNGLLALELLKKLLDKSHE